MQTIIKEKFEDAHEISKLSDEDTAAHFGIRLNKISENCYEFEGMR